ncbi:hypothetical protein LAZ67_14002096 [Cordylochernes scorpioides]|uniref:Uncharacterized protein n=1 Tax=Cordylochernes scorpioides TaxID=51811 RepID=A0ABY6L9A0_9ARAC|nr:hypothetical protein LAZ67_14002096 [Cordylochernes scorpioides]
MLKGIDYKPYISKLIHELQEDDWGVGGRLVKPEAAKIGWNFFFFIQDVESAHYSNIFITFLNEMFFHKLMGYRRPRLACAVLPKKYPKKRGNTQIFGGALILLADDFRQTLSAIPRSARADELNASLKSTVLWRGRISLPSAEEELACRVVEEELACRSSKEQKLKLKKQKLKRLKLKGTEAQEARGTRSSREQELKKPFVKGLKELEKPFVKELSEAQGLKELKGKEVEDTYKGKGYLQELRNPLIDKSGIYAKFDRLEALYLELVVLNEQYQEILLAKAEATDD